MRSVGSRLGVVGEEAGSEEVGVVGCLIDMAWWFVQGMVKEMEYNIRRCSSNLASRLQGWDQCHCLRVVKVFADGDGVSDLAPTHTPTHTREDSVVAPPLVVVKPETESGCNVDLVERSEAVCDIRLSTDGGYSTRKLHTPVPSSLN